MERPATGIDQDGMASAHRRCMHSVALRRLALLALPAFVAGFVFACSSAPTAPSDDNKGDSGSSTGSSTVGTTTTGATTTGGPTTASGKFADPCDAGDQCKSNVCCLPGLGCGPGGGGGGGGGGAGNMQGNNNYWCSARCDAGPQCPNTLDGDAGVCSKNGYCQR